MDQPIAALLTDLKARGLLDETLVVWGGEFGRTPMSEQGDGLDHTQVIYNNKGRPERVDQNEGEAYTRIIG